MSHHADLNALRTHLRTELERALLSTNTLTALRECIMHVQLSLDPPADSAPITVDQAAPTLRSDAPDFDSAPSVPASAEEIREYDRAESSSNRQVLAC